MTDLSAETSSSVTVVEEVKELIGELIIKYDLDPNSKITYSAGSEVGDNYASQTVAVDIEDGRETLNLFLKYAHHTGAMQGVPLEKFYANEIYFFDVIYPALTRFAEERGVKDAFANAPKCYGTSPKNVVALENLKTVGYELFARREKMNESHLVSVLRAFARYHALCFAFRDREKERFDELCSKILPIINPNENNPFKIMQMARLKAFFDELDPVRDKHILEKRESLERKANETLNMKTDRFVIIKGDCWTNNIMFRYENGDKTNPADVMLIDWQVIGQSCVISDLSYFFYTCACDEELDKLDFYLKVYHEELSERIKRLGSDPEILYPYSVLVEEWKQFCISGFMTAVLVINLLLVDKAPEFKEGDAQEIRSRLPEFKLSPEYYRRIKNIAEHFVKNKFL